jgi:hypothetical protein
MLESTERREDLAVEDLAEMDQEFPDLQLLVKEITEDMGGPHQLLIALLAVAVALALLEQLAVAGTPMLVEVEERVLVELEHFQALQEHPFSEQQAAEVPVPVMVHTEEHQIPIIR